MFSNSPESNTSLSTIDKQKALEKEKIDKIIKLYQIHNERLATVDNQTSQLSGSIESFSYQAPNPYPQDKSWLSWLTSSVSASSNSELVGKLVLPAQMNPPRKKSGSTLKTASELYQIDICDGSVTTHDGATLDTIQLTPNDTVTTNMSERYFIVKFNGNGMQYLDAFNKCVDDAQHLHSTVVSFNYRGVGTCKKAPKKFQDLVTDGIAQVKRLLDNGAMALA